MTFLKLLVVFSMVLAILSLLPRNFAWGEASGRVAAQFPGRALVSGKDIPVGTPDGRGPLAAHAITAEPLGFASIFGAERPDLLLSTTKFGQDVGLFLHPWLADTDDGAPVFGTRIAIAYPFEGPYPPPGAICQTADGKVHGIWLNGAQLVCTVLDIEGRAFKETGRIDLPDLPGGPGNVGLLPNPDGSVEILLQIGDGVPYKPTDFGGRAPEYRPYDGAGVWRGGFPYVFLYAVTLPAAFVGPAANARQISPTDHEVQMSYSHITSVNLGSGRERDVLCGSWYGGLYYYRNRAATGLELAPRRHIVDAYGNAHRHPVIHPGPTAYPQRDTGYSDLIAAGEGGLYYYRFSGAFTGEDKPIYDDPVPVLEEKADLYAGTLPVPNVVDWDGDGVMDIVSGNSEGRVLFFRNIGSNAAPAFAPGAPIEAGGRPIDIQPGYRDDIQGPGEARWGYACPAVADWNGDGLPDILMSDSTARHTIYLNRGAPQAPALEAGSPLYLDGLDLHGTWRVKPAVAKLGEQMAYVALDDDDEFHLYWRLDDYNLSDGSKLRLDDGAVIKANSLSAGGTGRLKLNLADWDRDGLVDMIVGTPRHGSVPNPETGLPQSLGLPGSAVLFLRNVGSNTAPVFKFPEIMTFRGEPIFLGQHACGPTVADFGDPNGPDMLVGEEGGRIIYYKREDLSHTRAKE